MRSEKFPEQLVLTREDLESTDWRAALGQASREGYVAMHTALSKAVKEALDAGRTAQGKVLWLFSDACSMMLKPAQVSEPFAPLWEIGDRRSVVADNFTDVDLDFFTLAFPGIDDPWLRARIADLLWVRRRNLGPQMALEAIDAYRAIPLNWETWRSGGCDCWKRAVRLATVLKHACEERFAQMERAIFAALERTSVNDGIFPIGLASLLRMLGINADARLRIAELLKAHGAKLEESGDLHGARDVFAAASDWFGHASRNDLANEMTVRVAETWVRLAQGELASGNGSHMVAASHFESAIQTYRSLPGSVRAVFRANERMEELRLLMNDSGERSLEEMGSVGPVPMDLTEIALKAQEAVSGKDPLQALIAFANHPPSVKLDALREHSKKASELAPLQTMIPRTHVDSSGRVVAKHDGGRMDSEDAEESFSALWGQMIRDYQLRQVLVVSGMILPALEILLVEHRMKLDDFRYIAQHSPIVPADRTRLYGTGLQAGYEGDFGTALHLLTPQLENIVRFHLKNARVKTTAMDQRGVETEIGFSKLMDLPEVETIFGKDLAFEFKALFCDPLGPNLRNEVAHGLLDDSIFTSVVAVYTWWLALRLAVNGFWNRTRKMEA
jgi:hypothetical protein